MEFLFSSDLYKSVSTGKLHASVKNDGIYLVSLRMPEKGSNKIIYRYFYYPNIFAPSILYFLIRKPNFSKSLLFRHWGDFVTIIDNDLAGKSTGLIKLFDNCLAYNLHFQNYLLHCGSLKGSFHDVELLFDVVKKTTLTTNNILSALNFALKKDYDNFFRLFVNFKTDHHFNEPSGVHFNYNDDRIVFNKQVEVVTKEVYLAEKSLFVVKDLEDTIKQLEGLGYIVAKTPKSQLHTSSSLGSFIDCVDAEYCDFLYNLHINMTKSGIIPAKRKLARSKFGYDNIHKNIIGDIKF